MEKLESRVVNLIIDLSLKLDLWFKNQSVYRTIIRDPDSVKSEESKILFLYCNSVLSGFGGRVLLDVSNGYTGIRDCISVVNGVWSLKDFTPELGNLVNIISKQYSSFDFNTNVENKEVALLSVFYK